MANQALHCLGELSPVLFGRILLDELSTFARPEDHPNRTSQESGDVAKCALIQDAMPAFNEDRVRRINLQAILGQEVKQADNRASLSLAKDLSLRPKLAEWVLVKERLKHLRLERGL